MMLADPYELENADVESETLREIASLDMLRIAKEDDLKSICFEDTEGLLVWYSVRITDKIIEKLAKCKVIVSCAVGYNNVDVKSAGEHGIYVSNVPDYCVDEVSDHTIGLVIALNRDIAGLDRKIREGIWELEIAWPVKRLRGRTLGILGLGRIGTATALKAKALGLRIITCDPYVPPGKEKSIQADAVDFETLLSQSDILSLHVPLTPETRHIINEESLRKMKKTALLISTCRGAVIDTGALVRALNEDWIQGAALDVQEKEPLSKSENPFLDMDNVILTPHSAYYSEESKIEMRRKAAEEVARVLRGEKPRSPVNLEMLRK